MDDQEWRDITYYSLLSGSDLAARLALEIRNCCFLQRCGHRDLCVDLWLDVHDTLSLHILVNVGTMCALQSAL